MNKLIVGTVLTLLCSVPSIARASTSVTSASVDGQAVDAQKTETAPTANAAGESDNYAARERATPQAGEFQGGNTAVYIGGGALTVVLLVVLIVVLL